jgi:hypothetical protein
VKIFIDRVERYYNVLIGLEKRVAELKEELQNLNIHRLAQQNINSALPYVGSTLARLLNRGLQENQIVELANLIELHPNMIQSYLQNDSNSRGGKEGQQQNDDFESVSSLSSSASCSVSSPPSLYSSSSHPSQHQSESPSQQQPTQSPWRSTTLTVKRPSSKPLIEHYSSETNNTTESSADGRASPSDTRSDIQSFTPSLLQQPNMKIQCSSSGTAEGLAQKQGAPMDKSYQPIDIRHKKFIDTQDRDQFNIPTLTRTATFNGIEVKIPNSILLGCKG